MRNIYSFFLFIFLSSNFSWADTGDYYFSGRTFKSQIGIWYTPWWDERSTMPFENWKATRYMPIVGSTTGYYNSNDLNVIDQHLTQIKGIGVDFIIFDGTNGFWGIMNESMESIRSKYIIPVSCALGGALISQANYTLDQRNNLMQTDADLVYQDMVARGNYYFFQSLPLMIVYNSYDVMGNKSPLPAWYDYRFNVQRATGTIDPSNSNLNFVEQGYGWNSWWGWYTKTPYLSPTAMSISPGIDTTKNYSPGNYRDREGGTVFMKQWITAIKMDPLAISVASWNDYNEETHIEPSSPITNNNGYIVGNKTGENWVDINNNPAPYLYTRIVSAYAALRQNRLIESYYYKDENKPDIYKIYRGKIVYIGNINQIASGNPIILLPTGWLEKIRSGSPI